MLGLPFTVTVPKDMRSKTRILNCTSHAVKSGVSRDRGDLSGGPAPARVGVISIGLEQTHYRRPASHRDRLFE